MQGVVRVAEESRHALQASLNDAVDEFNGKLGEIGRLNASLLQDKERLNDTLNEVENTVEQKNEEIQ
jgi:hypothetical protein